MWHAAREPPGMNERYIVQLAGIGFELVGVAVLVVGALLALGRFARPLLRRQDAAAAYRALRNDLGRAILLGLELLVAADIIRSVAYEPTFQSVGVLGLLVVVRTFLSWSLEVEISGRWPWQRAGSLPTAAAGAVDEADAL
jgi:uncharacterized membrane protein